MSHKKNFWCRCFCPVTSCDEYTGSGDEGEQWILFSMALEKILKVFTHPLLHHYSHTGEKEVAFKMDRA